MKQAAKATALVLAVSLLSGCSSAEAKACKAAQEQYSQYDLQFEEAKAKHAEYSKAGEWENAKLWLGQSTQSLYNRETLIIMYQSCFTPKEVVEAKIYLNN
jgi:flagellar basal body L-ring protein FlgH